MAISSPCADCMMSLPRDSHEDLEVGVKEEPRFTMDSPC